MEQNTLFASTGISRSIARSITCRWMPVEHTLTFWHGDDGGMLPRSIDDGPGHLATANEGHGPIMRGMLGH